MADRLKDALGLDVCEPLLRADDAGGLGYALRDNQIAFYLERDDVLRLAVPVNKRDFFGKHDDLDHYFYLIVRVWRDYLNAMVTDAVTVMAMNGRGLSNG